MSKSIKSQFISQMITDLKYEKISKKNDMLLEKFIIEYIQNLNEGQIEVDNEIEVDNDTVNILSLSLMLMNILK